MIDDATIPAARHVRPLTRALTRARAIGIPQYAIAAEAGISESLLSMISNGRVPATPEVARRVASALGEPVAHLFPEL